MEGKRNVPGRTQAPAAPAVPAGGKGTIRGRVVDAAAVQQPIRKARLRLYKVSVGDAAASQDYGSGTPAWQDESRIDGTFEVVVEAADYVLVAEAYGVDSQRETVHVQPNCWTDVAPLAIQVGLALSATRTGAERERSTTLAVPMGTHVAIEAAHHALGTNQLVYEWRTTAGAIVERSDVRSRPVIHLDTSNFTGPAVVTVTMSEVGSASEEASTEIYSDARPTQTIGGGISVALRRTSVSITDDLPLWLVIRRSTDAIAFRNYRKFIDLVLCNVVDGLEGKLNDMFGARAGDIRTMLKERLRDRNLPFTDVEAYRLLKVATEAFLMVNCGVALQQYPFEQADLDDLIARVSGDSSFDLDRLGRIWEKYLLEVNGSTYETLPYLEMVMRKFPDVALKNSVFSAMTGTGAAPERCYGILLQKLTSPCLLELIWSYWHEEGMLVQTLNAISVRFQNRRGRGVNGDPLANMEIDPLRPLNNLLWGYIQDEQHRLSVVRRAYEYDHHYGLRAAGPGGAGAAARRQPVAVPRGVPQSAAPVHRLLPAGRRHDGDCRRLPGPQRAEGSAPDPVRRARTTSSAICPRRRASRC